ncbi:peptidoglycan-associated lipoprotein Pal [Aestuariivita sp.]|jgi:peptidoglycan-associated lipoprotein|uniref:peptidoglycan-associated lipoprotein Pal n=1 Tax=Aestuariivita sp. TaxID=1872407 RepID=UPI00216DFEAA|nr:peptidoglycan-associated lipoprotein Pal [Aestuariivita sp.]MCE8005900.1 peptidoglycan-associated lipoprotein Pal [Aestuariivita sp.]
MTYLSKAAMLCAMLALGACSNALGQDDTNAVDLNGTGNFVAGSPGDPTSPAHFQQVVGDRVFFAVDQSTLSAEAQTILAAQATWLLTNSDFIATIEGHADEQGTREYNIALGARRATAVREFLVSRGIPGSRLSIISYGKERPVEICSDEACYAKNRRSVTVLASGLTG